MDKPIYVSFAILQIRRLHMYEKFYEKLQPYLGQENIQCHYMDTDSFVLCVITTDSINDLKNLKDIFDFSNLNKDHELFSNKNKKSNWLI